MVLRSLKRHENANKIITQSLNIISPNISIVSEETYDKSDEIPNGPYWVSRSFRWDERVYLINLRISV